MKIATLGEGITTKAVQKKIQKLDGFELTHDIDQADLVITSPGVPPKDFPNTSAPIISEIEFAYQLFHRKESTYRPKLIGVTGTNGKTTVTSLIGHILNAPTAGNIGIPLINFVDEPPTPASNFISVELSSYQLECCTTFKPEIAIWMNLTDDHMERHKTMEEYAKQKAKIFLNQTPKDCIIYPLDDPLIEPMLQKAASIKIPFSDKLPEFKLLGNTQLIGHHNKLNALAAFLATKQTKLPTEKIMKKINSFPPVEHRIEFVLSYQDRTFYNDSKGTNPSSTQIAVDACNKPIHLLICGKDKGLPLESFIYYLHQKVKTIILFGEMAGRFKSISEKINPQFPLYEVNTIDEAIQKAFSLSNPNEIILFSPSSSSFDQFKNYEERGKIFKQYVTQFYGKT